MRSCLIASEVIPANGTRMLKHFDYSLSRCRCIVENCIGLLKIKWRRFDKHQIVKDTDIVPDLIICACVLHNICIDAGDVNNAEAKAIIDDEDVAEKRAEINTAYDRITSLPLAHMSLYTDDLIATTKDKISDIFNLWSFNETDRVHDKEDLQKVSD